MNLIALILGLLLERLVTQLLHLREPRWMDQYFDWCLRCVRGLKTWQEPIVMIGLISLPVLPVLAITVAFRDVLLGVPYVAFAIVLLIFSLGPRDLQQEVTAFCKARRSGDEKEASRSAKELTESDLPRDPGERELALEDAVLVQALNRIFAVVFWFMLLGPVGAWMFRVVDLFRRRRAFEKARQGESSDEVMQAGDPLSWIHGLLAWIPARLLAVGYAIAGSFDGAFSAWRGYAAQRRRDIRFFQRTREMVAIVGQGALEQIRDDRVDDDPQSCAARAAIRLIRRALFVWVFGIAVLTLLGLAV